MKKELLAPAGDIEAGYAALYYGADAVYLGLQQFSARATATNFNEQNLDEFVAFAHSLSRKVYVAVNTLVQESELSDLLKTLDICARCMVDGVIVQDLGAARIVRDEYPQLELHASTQMAVHNKEGALALKKMGFSRVVVARELSLPEIKEIAAIPDLEIEAFVHGALCYSYSGLCMFSSLESGKSANRGKCLYPCRSCFDGESGTKHYFSMKDMALQEDILKMPAFSLKIEGRKKTALYVAAVTNYYRRILDGKGVDASLEDDIKQIFSRPWCSFHFRGKNKEVIDRDFVGHRGLCIGKIVNVQKGRFVLIPSHKIARFDGLQIDIPGEEKPFGFSLQNLRVRGKNVFEANVGDEVEITLPPKAPFLKKGYLVYLASSTAVKGAYSYTKPKAGEFKNRVPIDVDVLVLPNKISVKSGSVCVEENGNFEKAENIDKLKDTVQKVFEKTGDTSFLLNSLNLKNEGGYFVPISVLNDLRRRLYASIEICHSEGVLPDVDVFAHKKESKWLIKTDNVSCLQEIDLSDVEEIIFLLSKHTRIEDIRKLPRNKVRLALPALCRKPRDMEDLVSKLLAQGYKKWEIGNYWGLSVLPEKGIDLSFDYTLYTLNTQAMQMAKEIGASRVCLSVEDTHDNLDILCHNSPLSVVLPIYQDVALFTSAACIRNNPCKDCPRDEKWFSLERNSEKYYALSRDCQTMLFADKALCWGLEAKDLPADYYRVDFCYRPYTSQEALKIWQKIHRFEDVSATRKGNMFRKI